MNINCKILDDGYVPTKGTEESAGFDLFSPYDEQIEPNCRMIIDTKVIMEIPTGYYGRIASRSGLALKNGINVLGGVVDSDYRGPIKCILHNTDSSKVFKIDKGNKIAQIIITPCPDFKLCIKKELSKTVRNESGFGSTGA